VSRVRVSRARGASVVEGVRATLGVVHLLGAGRQPRTAVFNRVLGARQLAQATLLLRSGSGNAHTLGAAVDAVHAVTMLPLLFVGGPWRRVASSQLAIASALAVAEAALVGAGRRR
jgi:hypothetical protein